MVGSVVDEGLECITGALEGREAGADRGAQHHPVARPPVGDRPAGCDDDQRLRRLFEEPDADEVPDRAGEEVDLGQGGEERAERPAAEKAEQDRLRGQMALAGAGERERGPARPE